MKEENKFMVFSPEKAKEWLKLYGKAVPRYTSYPTAPHFKKDFSRKVYESWLERIPSKTSLSLYCHIPYCDTLCWFCGCHTKITQRYDPVGRYVESLMQEIELVAQRVPKDCHIGHLHWGGGSPTLLSPKDSLRLVAHISKFFHFDETTDFAVEIDPRGFTNEEAEALAKAGLTRASIGVQDFNPKVQKAINRIQSYEETQSVVDMLRQKGVDNINLDIMYGLPYQDKACLERTVSLSLAMRPNRISVFGYAHVPWMKTHMRLIPQEHLPDTYERFEQAKFVSDKLQEAGYVKIGFDHFSLPDDSMSKAFANHTLKRNFQGYTVDNRDWLIGFGASSIGETPYGYIQNTTATRDYQRQVAQGELPISKGLQLNQDDLFVRSIIMELMCYLSVNLTAVLDKYKQPYNRIKEAMEHMQPFIKDGLVEMRISGGISTAPRRFIIMTKDGAPFVRAVAACFDDYLRKGHARHSIAV